MTQATGITFNPLTGGPSPTNGMIGPGGGSFQFGSGRPSNAPDTIEMNPLGGLINVQPKKIHSVAPSDGKQGKKGGRIPVAQNADNV